MSEQATYTRQTEEDATASELEENSLDTALLTEEERRQFETTENATDRRRLRKYAQERRKKEEERNFVLSALLSQPNGRAFVMWLTNDLCGVFGASINADLNPHFLMHREGQRAVGLVIQAECVRADANNYATALRERFEGDRR